MRNSQVEERDLNGFRRYKHFKMRTQRVFRAGPEEEKVINRPGESC